MRVNAREAELRTEKHEPITIQVARADSTTQDFVVLLETDLTHIVLRRTEAMELVQALLETADPASLYQAGLDG
jgi:hypothetical protein